MVAISNPNCVGCAFWVYQSANLAKFCRYYSRFCGRCRQNAIDNLPKWGVITYLHKSFNDGQKWQTGRKFDDVWAGFERYKIVSYAGLDFLTQGGGRIYERIILMDFCYEYFYYQKCSVYSKFTKK